MQITYPLMTVVDDSGAVVSGATVAITSVKDKSGADIDTPGATIHQSGANVSVDYDAAAKGEAWIVLAISKLGSTFTGLNAAPAFYLSGDPGNIGTLLSRIGAPAGASLAADVAGIVAALVASSGLLCSVNDSAPTATGFTIAGAPANAALNAYAGRTAIVITGANGLLSGAPAFSAPITASTAGPGVRLTLGSGLGGAPDNGARIWVL